MKKSLKLQGRFYKLLTCLIHNHSHIDKEENAIHFFGGQILTFNLEGSGVLGVWLWFDTVPMLYIEGDTSTKEAFYVNLFDEGDITTSIGFFASDLSRADARSADLFFEALCGFWRELNDD